MSALLDRRPVLFRMPEDRKIKFKIAAMKNHVNIQGLLESFSEVFISFSENGKGELDSRMAEAMKTIVRRAQSLKGDIF